MRISDWSSDVCSSDLARHAAEQVAHALRAEFAVIIGAHAVMHPVHCRRRQQGFRAGDEGDGDGRGDDRRVQKLLHQIVARQRNGRSEEHTSELQSLMRSSYAVFCLKKKSEGKSETRHYSNYEGGKTYVTGQAQVRIVVNIAKDR